MVELINKKLEGLKNKEKVSMIELIKAISDGITEELIDLWTKNADFNLQIIINENQTVIHLHPASDKGE